MLLPVKRQDDGEEDVQCLEDGNEAGGEKSGPDKRERGAEPKAMVKQPERRVGFAAAEIARETDEDEQGAEKEIRAEPDLPEEIKQDRDCREAGNPKQRARGVGTASALNVEVDGDGPQERRDERAEDPEIDI